MLGWKKSCMDGWTDAVTSPKRSTIKIQVGLLMGF